MIISQKWVLHKKPSGFNKMLETEGMYWNSSKMKKRDSKMKECIGKSSKIKECIGHWFKMKECIEFFSKNEGMY